MNSGWDKVITLGIALGLTLSITISVLFIVGWKTENETTDTEVTVRYKRVTRKLVQEGAAPPASGPSVDEEGDRSQEDAEEVVKETESGSAPLLNVTGSWVSGRSTMKYMMHDNGGRIEVNGFDVMRGQRVFCGSGRMIGRKLTIPDFYSFLDETRGTLKLELSEDGKTLEGYFEGNNPAQEARVVMVRLP